MLENKEIWKDIKGYPGYQISNLGRVWNGNTQRILKPSKMPKGYYQINMVAINGKRKKELVHRLVALAFIPNPDGLPEVDHKDRDRGNNKAENLQWTTRSGNCRNSSQNRRIAQFDIEGNLIREYNSLVEAAEAVNGAISSFYSYFRRGQHTYKNYIWKLI